MAKTTEKYKVTPFKDSKDTYWVDFQVYRVTEKGIEFVTGGLPDEKAIEHLTNYLKL